jgi:hypothetical protein
MVGVVERPVPTEWKKQQAVEDFLLDGFVVSRKATIPKGRPRNPP